jgi:hypothetical protein
MPTEYLLGDEALEGHRARAVGRRQLLKTLLTAGGTVTASILLPSKWIKPAVEMGVLPAHAQVSPTPTPSPTPSPTIMCYTPTPSHTATPLRCYTAMPSDMTARPSDAAQPSSVGTPEARRLLLEQLLAEGHFPQDIARNLQ